jgi:ATP-dependent DNA ligase
MYTGRVPLPFIQPCEPSSRDGHLIQRANAGYLHFSEPFTNGLSLFAECEERGLEGVIAKHINSIYRSGPSSAWIKVKCPTWREANKNRADVFNKHRS